MLNTLQKRKYAANVVPTPNEAAKTAASPTKTKTDTTAITVNQSPDWFSDNAASVAAIIVAAAGVSFALLMNNEDAGTHYIQKCIILIALLIGILGWCFGGTRSAFWHKSMFPLLCWFVFGGFALYAALVDPAWQILPGSNRFALGLIGVTLIFVGCRTLTQDAEAQFTASLFIWVWLMAWALFFIFAPGDIALKFPSWGEDAYIPYVLFFFVVGGGGGVVLVVDAQKAVKGNESVEPKTDVGNAKIANPMHILGSDITDDWREGNTHE